MRLSPPIAILVIVAAAFGVLAVSHQKAQSRISSSCRVLTAFLKSETKALDSNFMVQDFPDQAFDRSGIEWRLELNPEARNDPLVPLYRQLADFREAKAKPTKLCPDLRAWLKQTEVRTNSDEARVLLLAASIKGIPLPRPIFSIAMPAVDSAQDDALLPVIIAQDQSGSGAFEVRLKRKADGNWAYEKFQVGGVP